jgi:deoxyribonuclease IV
VKTSERRIGAHLPLGPGMVKAADRANAIGASTLQVFTDNPTAWRRRDTLPAELPAFRARLADHGLQPLSVHAPYLINLAGPDPVFFERSCAVLAQELRVAAAYGARFVNVHIGSHRGIGVEAGIARLADGARTALDAANGASDGTLLVLENSSGGGFALGSTIEELGLIDDAMDAAGIDRRRIAYCLDTAHLWGAGYAIDAPDAVDAVLAEFDSRVGLERLAMVHLNDSRSALGSRTDRHEHVGAGRIGAEGLRRFLTHPALGHVTYMLETPGTDDGYDEINLRRARDLAAGRTLDPLPPEAFELKTNRGRSAPAEEVAPGGVIRSGRRATGARHRAGAPASEPAG